MPECKSPGCKTQLVFAIVLDEHGIVQRKQDGSPKKIPLEECRHAYIEVDRTHDGVQVRRASRVYISHFLTCKQPNLF